jgi:hypothetical protein
VRALAVGNASGRLRFASMIRPTVVRVTVGAGLQSIFLASDIVALLAAVITGLSSVETKGRVLEEVSP